MLVDTHAHLWWPVYRDSLERVILHAKEVGVEKIIVPGTDFETSRNAVQLAQKYSGYIYAAVGIHPEETTNNTLQEINIEKLQKLIEENRKFVVAVGEIGLDTSTQELANSLDAQKALFKSQCMMALEFALPVIIHSRQTLRECLDVLDSLSALPKGQFHCFSHDEAGLNEVLKRGYYVSYCGNISWSKRVKMLALKTPLERLLLETDSPLMTPRNERGELISKQNEPANVRITAQMIADEKKIELNELSSQTINNTKLLYGI